MGTQNQFRKIVDVEFEMSDDLTTGETQILNKITFVWNTPTPST